MLVFAHVLRLVNVLDVDDHVLLSAGNREQVIVGGEHVVHAAREFLIERSGDFRVRRRSQVEDDDAVHAVRCTFTRQYAVSAIGRNRHVVDGARVDLDRIRLHDVVHVRDVEHHAVSVAAPRAHQRIIAAILAGPRPQVRRGCCRNTAAPGHRNATDHVTRLDLEHFARHRVSRLRENRKASRIVRGKTAPINDAGAAWRNGGVVGRVAVAPRDHGILHRCAGGRFGGCIEMHHLAGQDHVFLDVEREGTHRIGRDRIRLARANPFGFGADHN